MSEAVAHRPNPCCLRGMLCSPEWNPDCSWQELLWRRGSEGLGRGSPAGPDLRAPPPSHQGRFWRQGLTGAEAEAWLQWFGPRMPGHPGSETSLWEEGPGRQPLQAPRGCPLPRRCKQTPRPGQREDRDLAMPLFGSRGCQDGIGELTSLLSPPVVEDQHSGQYSHKQDQSQQDTKEHPL